MDYTPNIDAQGMRRPMGPVDQPNWNGGPKLIHNPQVMNNQTVGQPNLANGDGSYGYNPNRYASSGRYASAGHGSRYGYMPYLEGEDYTMQQYLTGDPTEFADQMKLRYGYMDQNEPKMMNKPVSTYGAAYDSWSDARKHYTKTGSSEDKERMERHGEEHVEKAIISMRDIWSEASPELKRRMKTELSTLVDGMSI